MDRAALEGLRQQYAAMRWGQIIYAEDLCHVLDALLSEASPVARHWPDGTVVQATGSGMLEHGTPRAYTVSWPSQRVERYCARLENWSA